MSIKKIMMPRNLYSAPLVKMKRSVISIRSIVAEVEDSETVEVPLLLSLGEGDTGNYYESTHQAVDIVKDIIIEGHVTVCIRFSRQSRASQRILKKFFALNKIKTAIFCEKSKEYHVFTDSGKGLQEQKIMERYYSAQL